MKPTMPTESWFWRTLEVAGALLLALLWLLPLLYDIWAAFHPQEFATRFDVWAP